MTKAVYKPCAETAFLTCAMPYWVSFNSDVPEQIPNQSRNPIQQDPLYKTANQSKREVNSNRSEQTSFKRAEINYKKSKAAYQRTTKVQEAVLKEH